MAPSEPDILLINRRQAIKVRAVFWALCALALLAAWGGWSILWTWGMSEADGGVLKPLWQRLALSGLVAGLGLAAAGGMCLYISLYALGISRQGDRVEITTMTPWGRRVRVFPVTALGRTTRHHGRVHRVAAAGSGSGLWVNAPWLTLPVAGRRLPFIIDLQAEVVDIGALAALSEPRPDPRPARRA